MTEQLRTLEAVEVDAVAGGYTFEVGEAYERILAIARALF
jgi:hypothetical protein